MLLQIPKSIESQKTVIHHDIRHKKPILLYEVLAISLSLGSHLSTVIAIDGDILMAVVAGPISGLLLAGS